MENDKLLKNLISIINELPCQGQKGSSGRCHQVNCLRCQALNQVEFAKAKDITSLKDKLKSRFSSVVSWFSFKRKKTSEELIVELKKLGFFKE